MAEGDRRRRGAPDRIARIWSQPTRCAQECCRLGHRVRRALSEDRGDVRRRPLSGAWQAGPGGAWPNAPRRGRCDRGGTAPREGADVRIGTPSSPGRPRKSRQRALRGCRWEQYPTWREGMTTGAALSPGKLAATAVYLLFWPLLVFVLAGTLRWIEGWIFTAWFLALCTTCIVWLYLRNPALLAERYRKPGTGGEARWDQLVVYAIAVGF